MPPASAPRIEALETLEVHLPTRRDFRWASLEIPLGDWLIIRLRAEGGLVGYGEATALPDWGGDAGHQYGETPSTVAHIVQDLLAPVVVGLPVWAFERLHAEMDRVVRGHPYAKAAIDMAAYDAAGKALGVPAYVLLGGPFRNRVRVAHMIGLMSPEDAVEEARAAAADGATAFQVKGGLDLERDVEVVSRIREALGPRAHLRLDANAGYPSAKAAIRAVRSLAAARLDVIEQPVKSLDAMAAVTRAVEADVMADESAWSPADVAEIGRRRAADAISVYVAKSGGLFPARKVLAVAEAYGLGCDVNGSIETGIGNAASLQLAACGAAIDYPAVVPVSLPAGAQGPTIAGHYYLDDLICQPMAWESGCLLVPDGPGLGVQVDEASLARLAARAEAAP